MPKINSNKDNEEYCVLFTENKGYYLSKTKIADSLGFDNILIGTKKDCLDFIESNNAKIRKVTDKINSEV